MDLFLLQRALGSDISTNTLKARTPCWDRLVLLLVQHAQLLQESFALLSLGFGISILEGLRVKS